MVPLREDGLLPELPFGSDLTREEITLARALRGLRDRLGWELVKSPPRPGQLLKALRAPAAARPYLERMELDRPRGLEERALRRAVLLALALEGAI